MQTDLFDTGNASDLIIGGEYTYCGKTPCTLLDIDGRYVLIRIFGIKLCTTRSALAKDYRM